MNKRNLYTLLLAFITLGWTGTAAAQQVQLSASWDTSGAPLGQQTSITIGDQLDLVLSVNAPKMPTVVFPTAEELNRNDIIVLSQRVDTLQEANGYTLRQHSTVTSFEVGDHGMGAIQLQVGLGGGLLPMICPDSLTLTVLDVPNVDTTKAEIKDIADIMKEPYTFWEIFRWVLLAILVAAIVWGVIFVVGKLKKHEPIITIPQAPPTPPDKQALDELERLRTKGLWQSGRVKEYHTELTDIIRQYMSGQFGIDSTEMTSDQTLDSYHGSQYYKEENYEQLRQMLHTADMVKFAKHEPQPYEHDLSMTNAKLFVEETSASQTSTEDSATTAQKEEKQ